MAEKNYTVHLTCSKETRDLIMITCVNVFLRHHKDFKGMKITSGFILKKIAEYYVKDE